MYKTTLKEMRRLPELTNEIMFAVYNNGGSLNQIAYSAGIYGCTGQVYQSTIDGARYYTTDIYAGLDYPSNCRLDDYMKENGLSFTRYGRTYPTMA